MGKSSMAVSYADAKIEVEGLVERFARNLDVYNWTLDKIATAARNPFSRSRMPSMPA